MLLIIINVIFVLSAIAMTVLILLQRGSDAGAGFGGGASATVFGASGSANFLSKSTKWLAVVFFSISLGLAVYASKPHQAATVDNDLGVMGQAPGATTAAPVKPVGAATNASPSVPVPVAPTTLPSVPASGPAVPAPQPILPASNSSDAANQGNKGG